MENSNLSIVIKAIDEASETLKKISANTEQMGKSISESNTKASDSVGGLRGSYTELNSELELVKKAYDLVIGAVSPFIEAAIKESETMAQVKVNIDNAGLSFAKLGPLLEETAKKNIMLGFAGDDTQLSVSKLVLATGSYDKALRLNQLAMDLSRAKHLDLDSATVLVQQVMAGNVRVLKQYGISLDSTATSADALNMLHEKLKGSAEAFANSTAGKAAEVTAQWDRMKEDIGKELMPIVLKLFDAFEKNLPEIEKGAKNVAGAITSVATVISDNMPAVEALVGAFVTYKALSISIAGYTALNTMIMGTGAVAGSTAGFTDLLTMSMIRLKASMVGLVPAAAAFASIGAVAAGAGILISNSAGKLGDLNASVIETAGTAQSKAEQLAQAYNKVHKTALTAMEFGGQQTTTTTNWLGIPSVELKTGTIDSAKYKEALKDLAAQTAETTKKQTELKKGVSDATMNFNDFPPVAKNASTAVADHAKAVASLSEEYTKMSDSGKTAIAELSDSFGDKMKSINASIQSTENSMAELTASYSQSQTDNTKGVAESIVASETKIADIKKQMLTAVGADQYQALADQLAAEQANYNSSQAFRDANATAIEEARRRAKETDLQRTIEDYNAKAVLDAADYAKQMTQLQQQLNDKQAEATSETLLYQTKVDAINKMLDDANVYFKKLSDDRVTQTTDEVNAEIKQFQALATAISQTKSASSSSLGTISVPNMSKPTQAFETGGFVDAPRGTAVPIIAHGGEMVIPAEQSGRMGGSNVNITINNPVVRNDGDIINLRKQIDEVMRPLLQNVKIAHT